MVYSKARLKDALRVFRNRPNCRDRRALPLEKLASRLRSSRASAKVTPLDGVNWQAKSGASGSDDDEYNPDNERKQVTARRNKKKRKSDDVAAGDHDTERNAKKMKGDNSSLSAPNDSIFCTIKLTSEKGIQFLRGIDALGRVLRIGQGGSRISSLSKPAPRRTKSYFDKYLSTDVAQDREVMGLVEDGLVDMDVDIKDESISNKHKVLRNGKVVEKPAGQKEQSTKSKFHVPAPSSDDELDRTSIVTKLSSEKKALFSHRIHLNAFEEAKPVTKKFDPGSGDRSGVFDPKGSAADPISLDSDTEEVPTKLCARPGKEPVRAKKRSAYPTSKQENTLPPLPLPLSVSPAPCVLPTILTISTAFAHPLKLLPPTTPPAVASSRCHFCTDSRMAIIGLGRIRVEVFTDPDDPILYQEINGGFKGRGFENTTICFRCVEDRIRMMRCHLKSKQSHNTDGDKDENHGFEMIKVKARINGMNSNLLYRQWLFPKPTEKKTEVLTETEPPLLPCSLCPMPALWMCCRDQKRRVEGCAGPVKREDSVIEETDKIRMFDAGNSPSLRKLTEVLSRPKVRPVAATEVIIINSDSEDEPFGIASKEVLQQRRKRHTSQAPSKRSNRSRSATQISSPYDSAHDLYQTKRGCGLKLCGNCKHHVVDGCHGVLDKKVIMAQFYKASQVGQSIMTGRADVEFLFKGSVVDRFYEREMRKRSELARNQEQ